MTPTNQSTKIKIPLKQWLTEEAIRLGVCEGTVARKLKQGRYPDVQIERVNPRVVFIVTTKQP